MYGSHAWVPDIQNDWSGGMVRDRSRNAIPSNAFYDSTDLIFFRPGMLAGRGGTSYATGALAGATYASAVVWAEFPFGGRLVAIGDNSHIYDTGVDVGGSTITTIDKPKLRVGGGKNLLVFTASNGTSSPVKYDGVGAPAALGGSPPAGKYAAVYKSRLALGGASATPQRVYFSPTPDIESTWDTTNSWIDFDHPITGMVAVQNALIVFSQGHTERLTGDIPPPGSNMDRSPVGDIGCLDARSISVYKNNVIFAAQQGVYMTNGVSLESLTTKPDGTGIGDFWQGLASFTASTISTVTLGDHLLVFVLNSSGVLQAGLICFLPTRAWGRLTNIVPTMLAAAVGVDEEVYAADRATNHVQALSGILPRVDRVSSLYVSDANGTAVKPFLETRAYGVGVGMKAFGDVAITADLEDASGNANNPQYDIKYVFGEYPGSSTYTTATNSPFVGVPQPTDPPTRRRVFGAYGDGECVTLTITQTAGSGKSIIRGIEVNSRPYPAGTGGPLS